MALQYGGGHAIVGEKLRGASKLTRKASARPGRYRTVRDNLEVEAITVEDGRQDALPGAGEEL